MMTPLLELSRVGKNYTALFGGVTEALSEIDLTIQRNEILTIVGPSGSGKSTLLRLLAGLEEPTSGTLAAPGRDTLPRTGLVFQSNTVFPWRTVQRNLAFPLELRRVPPPRRDARVKEICKQVQLDPERFLLKYPKELSGGEARRVAIGMALANDSEILLLDEPTSQLDEFTRQRLQKVIYDVGQSQKLAVVMVTHDITEALLLGTRILLLWGGRVLKTFPVGLPHPRTDNVVATSAFKSCRAEVLSYFQTAEHASS